MTGGLHDALERSIDGVARGAVERVVFGTADATQIAAAVARAAELVLGVALVDAFFLSVSVGCVFGCELADGSRAVLKAHQPQSTLRFLADVQATQRSAVTSGLPGPVPIGSPTKVGRTAFTGESFFPDPGQSPAPELLPISARELARFVTCCEPVHAPALAEHPMRRTPVGLYPVPHSPLFDFAATGSGAEWIDDIATRARTVRDEARSPSVIAHTDWSLRNLRFDDDHVSAIYDWDSMALLPEAEAVGLAAPSWCKTGEGSEPTPSPDHITAFIDRYSEARPRPLPSAGRRAAFAAAVYGLAYTARCEHCLDPHGSERVTTRAALRDAAKLLR